MRAIAGAILVVLAVAGCDPRQALTSASPSPAGSASASATSPEPSLTCTSKPVPGHPLVLLKAIGAAGPGLIVLDTRDPLHPAQICAVNNADAGRFVSQTHIAFWGTQFVGNTDLAASSMNWSRAFLNSPAMVAFSADGSKWAWQTWDYTIHLVVGGKDQTISTRGTVLGQGWGPDDQLKFSPDGKYLLTYAAVVDPNVKPNFMVFAMDGSIAFQSATAHFGVWTGTGSRLYFLAAKESGGNSGDLSSWDPGGAPVIRRPGLTSYFWPAITPDGRSMVFNSHDNAGGPSTWGLDLASGRLVQLSVSISSRPVFVGPTVIWSTNEKPCACGPDGGGSVPDGKVLALDLQTGSNNIVGGLSGFTTRPDLTRDVLDVWLG